MSTFGSPAAGAKSIDTNDCNVPNAGTDGISSLSWSPSANILVSSNWDSTVTCWEVQEQGGRIQANPKAQSMMLLFENSYSISSVIRSLVFVARLHFFVTFSLQ
jgi:WD40 repeat protein